MKMKIVLTALILGSWLYSQSQSPTWQWIKGGNNGGSGSKFAITDMGVDNEGNIYGICKYDGYLYMDTLPMMLGYGGDDFCVFSYTCDGKFRWVKRFGGQYDDFQAGMTVLKNGETIITGNVSWCNWGNAWFADSMLTANSSICRSVFICKLDRHGNIIYLKFPSKEYEWAAPYAIKQNIGPDGMIHLFTSFFDSTSWGNFHIPDFGNYILKFNPKDGHFAGFIKLAVLVGLDTTGLLAPTRALYKTVFRIDDNGEYYFNIPEASDRIFIGNDTIIIDITSNYKYRGTLARFDNQGNNIWYKAFREDESIPWESAMFGINPQFAMDDNKLYLGGLKRSYPGTFFMGFPFNNPIATLGHSSTSFIAVFSKDSGNILNFRNLWSREYIIYNDFREVKNGKLYDGGQGGLVVLNNGSDTIKPFPNIGTYSPDGYFPFVYEIDTGLTQFNWGIGLKSVMNSSFYAGSMLIDHNNNILIGAKLSGGFILPQDTLKQYTGSFVMKIAHTNDSCDCKASVPVLSVVGSTGNTLIVQGSASNNFDSLYVIWGDGDSTLYANPGTTISHTYSNSGPWNVCLRSYAFCGDKDTCLNGLYLGTQFQKEKETVFSVFPNPTTDKVTVLFNELPESPVELQLFDITGRMIFNRFIIKQSSCTLDLSNLNHGIYVLRIKPLGEGGKSIKIIKR